MALQAEYTCCTLHMSPFMVYGMNAEGSILLYLYNPRSTMEKIWVPFKTQEERAEFIQALIPKNDKEGFTLDKFNDEEIVGCTGLLILKYSKVIYFVPAGWRKRIM